MTLFKSLHHSELPDHSGCETESSSASRRFAQSRWQRFIGKAVGLLLICRVVCGCGQTDRTGDFDLAATRAHAQQAAQQGNAVRAIALYQDELSDAEKQCPDDVRLATALNDLSEQYMKDGKEEKCRSLFKRAMDLCDENLPIDADFHSRKKTDEDHNWAVEGVRCCSGLMKVYSGLGLSGAANDAFLKAKYYCELLGDNKQAAKIERDHLVFQQRNSETEAYFDQAMLASNRKTVKSIGRTALEERYQKTLALAHTNAPDDATEQRLVGLLSDARKELGVRDTDYRAMLQYTFWFYAEHRQYNKAQQLMEDDARNFQALETLDVETAATSEEDLMECLKLCGDYVLLSKVYMMKNEPSSAILELKKAIAIHERYELNDKSVPDLHYALGIIYSSQQGNEDQAVVELSKALSLSKRLPNATRFEYLTELAAAQRKLMRYPQAVATYEQALSLVRSSKAGNVVMPVHVAELYEREYEVYRGQGKTDQAIEALTCALELRLKNKPAKDDYQIVNVLTLLTQLELQRNRPDQARKDALQALALVKQFQLPASRKLRFQTVYLLSKVAAAGGNDDQAIKYLRETVADSVRTKDDSEYIEHSLWLIDGLIGARRFDEASQQCERILKFIDRDRCKNLHFIAVANQRAGLINCLMGRTKLGLVQCQRALRLESEAPGADPCTVLSFTLAMADFEGCEGKFDVSQNYFDQALKMLESKKVTDNALIGDYCRLRALVCFLQGDQTRSKDLFLQSCKCTPANEDALKDLHSMVAGDAKLWGLAKPNLNNAELLSTTLAILKLRERACRQNNFFNAHDYVNYAFAFRKAGLTKPADQLERAARAILKTNTEQKHTLSR